MSRKRHFVTDEPFLVVRSSASDLDGGFVIASHAHEWHQLIFVSAGVIVAGTSEGSWVAPPSWAVWVPAGITHGIRFVGTCEFRTIYFQPEYAPVLPERCSAVAVSGLLRELILRVTEMGVLDRRDPMETAMATILLEEIRKLDVPSFALPQPTSELARRAAALIAADAPCATAIETLSKTVGAGARTLERRFVAETGMTLGRWRQHRALLSALEQLAVGTPIKTVAAGAGYATPSAFIAAFRKLFGTTPARYFDRR